MLLELVSGLRKISDVMTKSWVLRAVLKFFNLLLSALGCSFICWWWKN